MKRPKIAVTFFGPILALGLAVAVWSPAARADVAHQSTVMQFATPIQIPGNKVLPAGTYWFQVMNPEQPENVVAIYTADRSHLEALLLARPTLRTAPESRTEITLAKQSRAYPDVLVSWFYPGTDVGHEFVYSSRMESRLREEPKVTESLRTGGNR